LALAFCGRVAAVSRLLPLAPLDAENQAFWLATAELAAGERERPLARLAAIAGSDNAITASAARRRRRVPLAAPRERLTPADWHSVVAIEAQLDDDAAYLPGPYAGLRRSYVVLGLIAANLAFYLVELAEGVSQDDDGLLRLGALQSDRVLESGQWWRLLSAIFLHYGAVHLILNMLALAVIGVWVEQMLGRWRTLVIYFAAGLGSAAFVLESLPSDTVMVGASGAIFGLVGAQIALLGEAWRRHRSRHAGQRLFNLGLIILLQIAFDLATPEVSGGAHAAGLVTGLAAAVLVMLGHLRPEAG
jgi:rhomboid protease GluP